MGALDTAPWGEALAQALSERVCRDTTLSLDTTWYVPNAFKHGVSLRMNTDHDEPCRVLLQGIERTGVYALHEAVRYAF